MLGVGGIIDSWDTRLCSSWVSSFGIAGFVTEMWRRLHKEPSGTLDGMAERL